MSVRLRETSRERESSSSSTCSPAPPPFIFCADATARSILVHTACAPALVSARMSVPSTLSCWSRASIPLATSGGEESLIRNSANLASSGTFRRSRIGVRTPPRSRSKAVCQPSLWNKSSCSSGRMALRTCEKWRERSRQRGQHATIASTRCSALLSTELARRRSTCAELTDLPRSASLTSCILRWCIFRVSGPSSYTLLCVPVSSSRKGA
mmetsp:Transcript_5577/g.19168  ORF Transcript_5577/g.19168 Transcript_5577/m.19168 type:complete len:211 (+) Transcript_5577:110-742(+)